MWMSGELSGGGSKPNEWVAARGAVRRVCWSHPEFGQLLATAGAGEYEIVMMDLVLMVLISEKGFIN